jgi:hypothetical protein
MHRDDADGAAGPRGGREGHGREGERPGRTAPARRRPARGPSLRGIHVSPCLPARAGAGPDGVCRPGQPIRPDDTCPRSNRSDLIAAGPGGCIHSPDRDHSSVPEPPAPPRTPPPSGGSKSRDRGSRRARGPKAP